MYRFLIFIGFLCPGYVSLGQILVGPVMGGQMSFITFGDKSNKDLYKVKPYFGFHAGGSISFRVRKDFFLQTSILYSQKGKKMTGKQDQLFKNFATYRYIDVPILFTREVKVRFKGNKFYKVQLGAGPTVSYWLSGKGLLRNSDLNENGINPPSYDLPYHVTFGKPPEEVVKGEMNVQHPNRVQLGLNFSAGVIFEPTGLNKFMVTARYELGHSYLSPEDKGEFGLAGNLNYSDDLKIRIKTISLSVFYYIDLKTEERKKGKSTVKLKGK